VLGPILFIMYTADLVALIEQHDFCPHLYADDTQIYGFNRPDRVPFQIFKSDRRRVLMMSTAGCCLTASSCEHQQVGAAVMCDNSSAASATTIFIQDVPERIQFKLAIYLGKWPA